MNLKNPFKRTPPSLAGNKSVIKELWREIFEAKLYDFNSPAASPVILDVGANIGIATLFFKSKYPQAKIKAFEPVPESFADLTTNTVGLESVELFNVGLSDAEGDGAIYGESDTAIESMTKIFKETNKFSSEQLKPIPVKFKRLSSFITAPVDFLKIDIEGSEGKVFRELEESGKLKEIRELVMEYHYNLDNQENELGELVTRLHRNGFHLDICPDPKKKGGNYALFIRGKQIKQIYD